MSASNKIAVVGAGIGGFAVASMLADQGHDVTVFDQFDAPRPVGSGLVIQPIGQAVLDCVGAGDLARAKGNFITRMLGHVEPSGRRVLDVHYDRRHGQQRGLAIHRASLLDALFVASKTRDLRLISSAEIVKAGGGMLYAADGQSFGPFDLIIDSAGAGSPLSPIASRPLAYGAIWGTVDWPETDLPPDYLSQCYRRADRMVGVLPIGTLPGDDTPKAAVFWSMPRDGHAAWQERGLDAWRDEATALWPAFAPFADQITAANQMTMARYTHGTLRKPYGDGVVHIGDAAHRASPQLGQGANMALLDALALARAVSVASLDRAPALYAKARRWHVWAFQAMSAAFTPQYQSDSTFLPKLRDYVMFPVSQIPPAPSVLTQIVRGTILPPTGRLTHVGTPNFRENSPASTAV
ncbi:2-polyprenyl-6-methoxyphenol hydroxylase-like FAD-dependent oxidoreductase [Loktanella ponticola]|uniref:2-polyprenyl-6-methoxyphenol hydroxylase-like FAD-dependent oxidoreductase n=1 Tax=Yoonia ponticola TaxID=1524255 RepID=A0A7W9EY66_9RHOB|nr:NAD(P)/FAD-dependent oxidoreductase [Yoonia ponticola]MBB5722437.1 2-polyprenyl-6-methoxyphenol hydroxylase-like FAD-dependent oxidoreductase [Yoonia ponticola]